MKRPSAQFLFNAPLLWGWLSLSLALAQAPSISGVFNGPSAALTYCPGVLVVITGSNLADACSPNTASGQAPTVLCNARVTVGNQSAAMLLATPTELRAQLPVDAPLGSTTIVAERLGMRSAPIMINLDAFAPGLFFRAGNIGSISKQTGADVTAQNPASLGERLFLAADGLGPTNPPVSTGT